MKEFRFSPEIILDHQNIVPLRGQIITQMRQAVITHRVKPGTRVISERALAEKLSINRNTVHQAYEDLVESGLFCIQSARGGVRISPQASEFYKRPYPTINLLMPYSFRDQLHLFSPYGLDMFAGVLDRAAERQVSIQILNLPPPDSSGETIRDFLETLMERSIGIITMGRRREDKEDGVFTSLLKCKTFPHVLMSAFSPEYPHVSSVSADLTEGGKALLDHLKKQKIRVLGGFPFFRIGQEYHDASTSRWKELKKMALAEGFQFREYPLEKNCESYKTTEDFRKILNGIFSDEIRPQCLLCSNDSFACALIDSLRAAGKSVPEDFLVAGYDDLAEESYQLSSLNHSRNEIGSMAVDLILELTERHSAGEALHKTVPTHFIARKSTQYSSPK